MDTACSTEVNPISIDAIRNENEFLLIRIKGLEQVIQGLQETVERLEDELQEAQHSLYR